MARPKKNEEKPKEAPKLGQVQVNIEDFVRTRDSVVTGLATLQNAVQDLSRSYIAHTNTVLGRPLDTPLDENSLLGQRAATPVANTEPGQAKEVKQETKEKKKKRERDPNAPKRPLTAYFLFMKSARKIIGEDLKNATPGEIAAEGTRRWSEMPEHDKELWRSHYAKNLEAYNEEIKAYKSEHNQADDAAAQLAAEGAAAEELDSVLGTDHDGDDGAEVTPKTPSPPKSPKATKRRKITKESSPKRPAGAASLKETPILPPVSHTPVPLPGAESSDVPVTKSPEKRKRTSRKATDPAEVKEESKDVEGPKSSSKADSNESQKKETRVRKKRKSTATDA